MCNYVGIECCYLVPTPTATGRMLCSLYALQAGANAMRILSELADILAVQATPRVAQDTWCRKRFPLHPTTEPGTHSRVPTWLSSSRIIIST